MLVLGLMLVVALIVRPRTGAGIGLRTGRGCV
jgi:hypothetical protein